LNQNENPTMSGSRHNNIMAANLAAICASCLAGCSDSAVDPIAISSVELRTDFEGASIGSVERVGDQTFNLTIRFDTNSELLNWYSFRIATQGSIPLTFRITNAGQTSVAPAWPICRPALSTDGGTTWQRTPDVVYDGQTFSFTHTPASNADWVAYVPVYNFSRWTGIVEDIRNHPRVTSLRVIANSLNGNPIHLVEVTDPAIAEENKTIVWVTARQHPMEAGGSWMAEGMLNWLLGGSPQAAELTRRSVVFLVPFMNPDGVLLGNYRVNSLGMNLNRVWDDPQPEFAPSVAAVEREMESAVASGREIEIFVDFHTWSTKLENFLIYTSAEASSTAMAAEIEAFMELMSEINPDFSADRAIAGGGTDTRLARPWAFQTLGIQAVTFEGAYQYVDYGPNRGQYMTAERYLALGEAFGKATAEFFHGISEGGSLPNPIAKYHAGLNGR
jgi:hypothetical protein